MTRASVWTGVLVAMLALPAAAHAQGVPGGATHGFHEGNRIAGPVGAVVGTAVGGVIGGVEGVLGINQRPVAYSGGYEDAPRADVPPPQGVPRQGEACAARASCDPRASRPASARARLRDAVGFLPWRAGHGNAVPALNYAPESLRNVGRPMPIASKPPSTASVCPVM